MTALAVFKDRASFLPDVPKPSLGCTWLKEWALANYTTGVHQVNGYASQADEFLRVVQTTNGFDAQSVVNFRASGDLTLEVAVLPKPEVLKSLDESLGSVAVQLRKAIGAGLEQMRKAHVIGQIDWLGKRECRFSYFRRRQETQSTRQGDYVHHTRTTFLTGFLQEVVKARVHPWPGYWVKKPEWAEQQLQAVPVFLRPAITVLDGTAIREIKLERQVGTESWTEHRPLPRWVEYPPLPVYQYDPAIVLGDFYVLAGWSKSEC